MANLTAVNSNLISLNTNMTEVMSTIDEFDNEIVSTICILLTFDLIFTNIIFSKKKGFLNHLFLELQELIFVYLIRQNIFCLRIISF